MPRSAIEQQDSPSGPLRRRRRGTLFVWAAALSLFATLAVVLRWQEQRAIRDFAVERDSAAPVAAAPISVGQDLEPFELNAVRLVRSLKLVTVEAEATASASRFDQNWRGRAEARVSAPVRHLYGVDLTNLRDDAISTGEILGTLSLRLPTPERIASEVDFDELRERVDVGGWRFRSGIGAQLLNQARLGVGRAAPEATLSLEQQQEIRAQTRERVRELVTKLLRGHRIVIVRFEDEYLPSPAWFRAGAS